MFTQRMSLTISESKGNAKYVVILTYPQARFKLGSLSSLLTIICMKLGSIRISFLLSHDKTQEFRLFVQINISC